MTRVSFTLHGFTYSYKTYFDLDFWNNVLWTDQTKVEMFGLEMKIQANQEISQLIM